MYYPFYTKLNSVISGLPDTIGNLENLQKLNLERCYELKGSRPALICSTHSTPLKMCFSGLPDTIGKLENLQELNLFYCEKLRGNRYQVSFVAPMLHI